MIVYNRIKECKPTNPYSMDPDNVRWLVIHRISLADHTIRDEFLDGPTLASVFMNEDLGTSRRVPYHFLIRKDGIVEQLLPLSTRGAHARHWNQYSWGIAVVGNFTREAPTGEQVSKLTRLCRALYPINGGLKIAGHTNLNGATGDDSKQCPGDLLLVSELEDRIKSCEVIDIVGITV